MMLVDDALRRAEAEGRPVRVGLVGAGFMGRGIVRQIEREVPGMVLTAVANRTPDTAAEAYRSAGRDDVRHVDSVADLDAAAAAGRAAVTDDPRLLAESDAVDVIIEATGHVDHGALVTTHAIEHGTDVVLMNAEVDATIGPLLQERARAAGVIVTGCDGDQPGVQLNLLRFVRSIGMGRSLLAGAATLALLVLPIVIMASREALRTVPLSIREGCYALGATRWQAIRQVVLPMALPGILTGAILAISRAIGETAPLIVVGALTYITFLPSSPGSPFTALPIQIFNWVSRPQKEFLANAAAGIVVLLATMLLLNAAAILLRNRYQKKIY